MKLLGNEAGQDTPFFPNSCRLLKGFNRFLWILMGVGLTWGYARSADTTVTFVEQSPVYYRNPDYLLRITADSAREADSIYLFRGTEVQAPVEARSKKYVNAIGKKQFIPKPNTSRTSPRNWWQQYGNAQRLLEYLQWEKGIDANHEYVRVLRTWPNWVHRYRFTSSYLTGNELFVLGGTWVFTGYTGNLSDSLHSLHRGSFQGFGWSLTAGIPGLRYEIMASPWVLPDYSFLEKHLIASIDSASRGRVVRQYADPADLRSFPLNKAHRFEAKWGIFRYSLLLDNEVYRGPVHDFRLTGLPIIIGHWGMGIAGSMGAWVPGAWVHLGEFNWSTGRLFKKELRFKISLFRAELWFHELNEFHLGLHWNIHVNDPFAHRWESKS